MIKKILLSLIILSGFESKAQVGINTTTPKAQLEIKSSNETTPANTDGLLIPKINAFPVTNPTADQQGMLVYLTTTVGANTPGFYFWNNPTTAWLPVKGTDGGTLDQAYDFGGAGNGRTITADTGAVTIAGTDGLVSSGQFNTGAFAPDAFPLVPRMFWNPRKAAFRAGYSQTSSWTDINIGSMSVAFGFTTTASGGTSTAFGGFTTASGGTSTAFGSNTTASGTMSTSFGEITSASGSVATAFGRNTVASGNFSTVFGLFSTASGNTSTAFGGSTASGNTSTSFGSGTAALGDFSTAFGRNNSASSFGETVLGIGATTYTPSTNGATQFRTANAADRLFVIGNAIDSNNNNFVDDAERSDAMVVLKNGNVGVGISTPQNRLHFHNPTGFETFMQLTNATTGTTATDGLILGNTVSSGEAGIINLESENLYFGTSGNSENLVITPTGNVGIGTTGANERLEVQGKIRMVDGNQATGKVLTSDANGTATWQNASANAWGLTGNSGTSSTNFIGTTDATTLSVRTNNTNRMKLLSNGNIEIGGAPIPSLFEAGTSKLLVGSESSTTDNLTVWAAHSTTAGRATLNLARQRGSFSSTLPVSNGDGLGELVFSGYSNALGSHLTAASVFADVDGTLAANNVPAKLGFSTAPETGGSPIERMTIRANGNLGIGTTTPQERLHVAGKAFLTDGFSADNAALIYRNNTDYMFLGPQSGSSANGAAMALFGSTNTAGGNAGGVDFNVPGSQVRMNHTNGSYTFRANSTSGYAATFELNDNGLEIRHNSASRALMFSPNSTERMRLTPGGFLGIGTTAPARKLHVSNGVSGGTSNANTGILLESSGNVYQHYLAPSASESGMLFGSEVASINGGIIFNNSFATSGIQFRAGGNTNRMTITSSGDVGIGTTAPGGQFELSLNEGRKPTSNTWTIPSDARLKNVDGIYQKGLTEILQLKPIRYHYKNTDKKSFESEVLEKEAYGFLAQEVQQIFPEAVGTDADGYLNFDLHPILVAYTNAFKELDLKNQAAENKNRELELKLQSQEQIINNLMERLEKLEAKN